VVRKEGGIRAVSTHNTQREAIDAAREVARSKHGELIIHRRDGRIADRYSYNSDPLPPKSARKVLFHQSLDDNARRAVQAAVDAVVRKSERGASQHVVPHGKGWAVRSEGKTKSSSVHDTQSDAIAAAKELLRKHDGQLLIHGRHGQIRKVSTNGSKAQLGKH
jgi:uncharacterized protein YdaT